MPQQPAFQPQIRPSADIAPAPVAAMQRVSGIGRLSVKQAGGHTRIDRLFQEGAAKIRIPRLPGPDLEAVLINTAGGLTGGDEMSWRIEAAAGTRLTVTTQACEKTYRTDGGTSASISVDLSLGEAASLAWLPQETILFDRAALGRRMEVDMAAGSRLLIVEPVIYGRRAMGEQVHSGSFRDRWRIRHGGHLVHAEDFAIGPDIAGQLGERAIAGGATATAALLLVGEDAADRLGVARDIIGASGGASAWRMGACGTGKLLARVVAEDGYRLRKILVPLIRLLNGGASVPKIWSL